MKIITTHQEPHEIYHLFTAKDDAIDGFHPHCISYFGSSSDFDELQIEFIKKTGLKKRALVYKTLPDGSLELYRDFWGVWSDCRGNFIPSSDRVLAFSEELRKTEDRIKKLMESK